MGVFFQNLLPTSLRGTSRCVALSCLPSMKERSSRKAFHVTQASEPPRRERCLVPEGAGCARDDFL